MPGPGAFASYLVVLPLATIIGGPLGEELGFRGYALPLLQQRHPALVAVAILFAGHALWHLPLFFAADPPPIGAFLLGLLAGGVVLAWLLNSTGNIVLVMLLHGGFNTAQQQLMGGFTGPDSAHVQLLVAVGWAVAAGVVIRRTRGTLAPAGGSRWGTTPLHAVVSPVASSEEPAGVAA
jgi:membrane protease YdiL (CAAX protease family)